MTPDEAARSLVEVGHGPLRQRLVGSDGEQDSTLVGERLKELLVTRGADAVLIADRSKPG